MNTHQQIRENLRERIRAGEWELGELIPGEEQLAVEYGCARATVNRALRSLADQGVVIRKRKGGTRIRQLPKRQASFDIPMVRAQVEATGRDYAHAVLKRRHARPPQKIRQCLRLADDERALYLETLHSGNTRPFAFERRWINVSAVPDVLTAPFDSISANEWLIRSVPFTSAKLSFSAVNARADVAAHMQVEPGSALFLIDRTTWFEDQFVTAVELYHHRGFSLSSNL